MGARIIQPGPIAGLAMLVVALVGVGTPGIGWDEAATADVATRSAAEIWTMIQSVAAVIGPYYFFMHAWTSVFGLSELSLRLPSVLAMAAAVGLTAELGRRLVNPVVGTLAGLLLCALPAISRYAQEARPYALCCMFAALAALLLYRNLDHDRGVAAWAGYAAAVVLIGLFHLVAVSVLGAHAIVVLRPPSRRPLLAGGRATAAAQRGRRARPRVPRPPGGPTWASRSGWAPGTCWSHCCRSRSWRRSVRRTDPDRCGPLSYSCSSGSPP